MQRQPGESYASIRRLLGVYSRTSDSVRLVQLPAKRVSLTMSLFPPQRFAGGVESAGMNNTAAAEFHSAASVFRLQVLCIPNTLAQQYTHWINPIFYLRLRPSSQSCRRADRCDRLCQRAFVGARNWHIWNYICVCWDKIINGGEVQRVKCLSSPSFSDGTYFTSTKNIVNFGLWKFFLNQWIEMW